MTTLPSTSSIRLPRANAPLVSVPGQVLSPMPAGGTAVSLTGADMWRVIRSNLWLIALSALLGGLIGLGIYGYLRKYDPKFRSLGLVIVDRPVRIKPSASLRNVDDPDYDFNLPVEQHTQTTKLLSDSLWNEVLEKNDRVRQTEWYHNFEKKTGPDSSVTPVRLAREDLADNFHATPIPDTKLIQVSMDSANPDDARSIVQYIVAAHIDNQQKLSSDRTSQELNAATEWLSGLLAKENRTRAALNQLQANSTEGSSAGRLNLKEMELSQLIGSQIKARMETSEAINASDAIQEQLKKGNDPYQVEIYTRNDPTVSRLQSTVDGLDVEIEALIETSGTKSRMTADRMAQRKVAWNKLDQAQANSRAMYRNQIIESAASEITLKKAEESVITDKVEKLRGELGEISAQIAEYLSLKDELDAIKEQEREQNDRVAMLKNAARQNVASVSWYSLPTTPDTLSSPNAKVIIPLAVLIGVGLSLGIAFLREVSDTSVRSPRDISRVGPMNLLGMVSDETDDPQLAGVPLHLAISQAPHSMIAEQLRQVRTRLQHAASLDTMRTIAITSPGPGDGKSMIACNLAVGLALNGRRILLVDANFRRPELHRLFGVNNDAGFSGVLESVATLEAVTHKTQIPNLELLAAGPRPGNPTELFESPLFNDFIDRALEDYDHVIFDIGPLLVVSEAIAIAPRVDGVITVVRAKKNTRGMLSRVRETLKQIKAENLGVVLNGVKTWGGGYYARNIKTYYAYQNVE